MLYDYSAANFDSAVRNAFVAQGTNDPGAISSYLTDKAFSACFAIYGSIPFGNDRAAMNIYFGNAPDRVISALKFSK
jgi:hypothetical protein